MQLREEDFDGALLLPWLDAHTAPVAALAASTGAYWNNPLRHPLPHLHRCPYRIPVWRVHMHRQAWLAPTLICNPALACLQIGASCSLRQQMAAWPSRL